MTSPALETTQQPLIAHLVELRNRLLWVFGTFGIATCACYFFAADIYAFLTDPLAHLPHAEHRRLIYTGLTRARKLALLMGSRRAMHMGLGNVRGRQRNTTLALRMAHGRDGGAVAGAE